MNNEIDGNLIVSETNLSIVCDSEFNPNSWHIGELYIDYSVDIITDTFYNLYKRKVIDVELLTKEYIIFNLKIGTQVKYLIKLNKINNSNFLVGWFEERIINSISEFDCEELDKLILNLLNKLFGENYKCTNPGKKFIQLGLKNQKFDFFTFESSSRLLSSKFKVWQDAEQSNKLGRVKTEGWDNELNVLDIKDLRRIVKKQLLKFQNLGE